VVEFEVTLGAMADVVAGEVLSALKYFGRYGRRVTKGCRRLPLYGGAGRSFVICQCYLLPSPLVRLKIKDYE
jgi:hypothetical protein